MDAWKGMGNPNASIELITEGLRVTSVKDANPHPDKGPQSQHQYEKVGWSGQKTPSTIAGQQQQQQQQHNHHHQGNNNSGKRTYYGRGQSRERGRSDNSRRAKGYRKLWEQVTKVGRGQALTPDGKSPLADLSVEELVRLIQTLAPDKPVVPAVSQALSYLDSRALAALLKDLAKAGLTQRAVELFDWLRSLEPNHDLAALCDVYTYTTVISLCGHMQQLRRALELVAELRSRGIQCNVHTYSSLMNVCIKCGELDLALDVYGQMRQEGSKPNVVTYNTLIDVYGKTGQWEKAVGVLDTMLDEGLEPEVRTYNTAIIACNMCGQPQEALKVYERLLEAGLSPISTTYTALISAYGKAGQLDAALDTFSEMVRSGHERSVITYSALISACEKAGRWELALELFAQMHKEGCAPNTVTYNSLITACAQGAQWEQAAEVFEQMKVQGCKPDVVTYTALISAFERGGQWRRAVKAFEQMQQQGCRADGIIYHSLIDMLWSTGAVWAQFKALQLFSGAVRSSQFRLCVQAAAAAGSEDMLEVVIPPLSASVAVLALQRWLSELVSRVEEDGGKCLRERVVVALGRGRGQRESSGSVGIGSGGGGGGVSSAASSVKECVLQMMRGLGTPFGPADRDPPHLLQCRSWELAKWLRAPDTAQRLASWLGQAGAVDSRRLRYSEQLAAEAAVEARCREAFKAVQHFESTQALDFQAMGQSYLAHRPSYIDLAFHLGDSLALKDVTTHDAVLLMDRVMSTGIQLADSYGPLFVAAALLIAAKQCEAPNKVPQDAQLDMAVGFPLGSVIKMERNVRLALRQDTTAISSLRCLKLYYERLGHDVSDAPHLPPTVNPPSATLRATLATPAALNFRPSVLAAALLINDRCQRGLVPFWPTALAHLTGLRDLASPELTAARDATAMLKAPPLHSPELTHPPLAGMGSMPMPVSMPTVSMSPPGSLTLPPGSVPVSGAGSGLPAPQGSMGGMGVAVQVPVSQPGMGVPQAPGGLVGAPMQQAGGLVGAPMQQAGGLPAQQQVAMHGAQGAMPSPAVPPELIHLL